jgi:hypothetical protein
VDYYASCGKGLAQEGSPEMAPGSLLLRSLERDLLLLRNQANTKPPRCPRARIPPRYPSNPEAGCKPLSGEFGEIPG